MASNQLDAGQLVLDGTAQILTMVPSADTVRLKNLSTANNISIGHKDEATFDATNNSYPLSPGEFIDMDLSTPRSAKVLGTAGDRLAWLVIKP